MLIQEVKNEPLVSQPGVIFTLFVISGLYVLQRIGSTQEGKANFTLSGDYYNRELSGKNKTWL